MLELEDDEDDELVELEDDSVEDVELVLNVDVVELVDAIHSVTYSAASNSSADIPDANMPIILRMLLAFPMELGSIR